MASLYQRPGYSLYYIQHRVAGKLIRESTGTDVLQIAKEKLRQFESAQARGLPSVLPTKTPIGEILTAYVEFIRSAKTPKSAQTDIYYLRDAFGTDACDALKVTSRKISTASKKRPPKAGQDRRRKGAVIEAAYIESVTTAMISSFITGSMASRGLAPKTGNRIRDTLSAFFSWAISQRNIRMPGEKNPAAAVKKYSESAPEIRFLTLKQVDAQLTALNGCLHLQTMAAVLIFAGLRREELLQLGHDDIDLETGKFGLIRVRAKTVSDQAWQPKTKRNRGVPISSQLRPHLDKWLVKHPKGEWLFPSPAGKKWDGDNFSQDLRAANASAGLPDWFSSLTFRHTFGSLLAQRGVSLYHISEMMGNSVEICRRCYAALTPAALVDSVEFILQASPEFSGIMAA